MKTLKIDNEFKTLIRPLYRAEYMQLEANILADGCRDPIIVWDDTIIDGHNRYEICQEHNLPFETLSMHFSCREEAIAWICANQLGRRNLTDESRKFLIGKQYEASKALTLNRNVLGINQHTSTQDDLIEDKQSGMTHYGTAQKIADDNHISHGTVEKYAAYSRAIDSIEKKEPALVSKILSGKYKFSHDNIINLSKRSESEVKDINQRLENMETPFAPYQTTRMEINRSSEDCKQTARFSIKSMPQYDPDASLISLSITIPSWISSINLAKANTNIDNASPSAREKLRTVLLDMQLAITDMLQFVEED